MATASCRCTARKPSSRGPSGISGDAVRYFHGIGGFVTNSLTIGSEWPPPVNSTSTGVRRSRPSGFWRAHSIANSKVSLNFTADELRELVDERRLKRAHQRQDFDADRFAEFHWLVVEEAVTLDREPEARAVPVLFMNLNKDLGEIEPHKGRFPLAFEAALFFLLLAPWETWSTMVEVDWRGFRVPWVYTADSDIFVRANALPSVDT
jgi:hypothetical protein